MTEVFYGILKASFQGSIVILAVLVLRLLLKKAPKNLFCLLWLLAGLRLVLPFEIQSSLSLQPRLEKTKLSIQAEQPVQVPDILIQNPEGQPLDVPAQMPNLPGENREDMQTENLLYGVQDGNITKPIRYGDIAAGVWVLGMTVMLAASALSYFRLKRRVREAFRIENGCYECPGLETAFVLGFLPPKIYLPMGLSDREKAFIYDHENTHIARHDHWFKVLGYVVLSIHWYNPLAWLGYGALCRDMELACDEHVVRNMTLPERKAYSAALLSCGSHTARLAACPVAFGESNPKKRILNVLNYKRPGFWISLLAVVAVIFVSVCLLTSPAEEADPQEPNIMQWNLEMQVTDVTPSGLTVEFIQHGDFPDSDRGTLSYGSYYGLQVYKNGEWAEVEPLVLDYQMGWSTEAYLIALNSTNAHNVSWEWLYGALPAGHYRIGKNVTFSRGAGENEDHTLYAEFDIEKTAQERKQNRLRENWLEKCRAALEDYQAQGTWAIQVENSFWGLGALNSSSMSQWFGNGEDYWTWSTIPEDTNVAAWWDLQVNGEAYHRTGHFPKDGSEEWISQWEEGSTDNQVIYPYWPLWYDWVDADIVFVEQGTEDSSTHVTLTVQGCPFPDNPNDYEIGEYQVTFQFQHDMLHIIELSYERTDSFGGGTRRYDLYAFASKDVENKINQCHSEALLHVHGICNDPDCTNMEHNHYGIACTVEHCTNPAHGHGDENHH